MGYGRYWSRGVKSPFADVPPVADSEGTPLSGRLRPSFLPDEKEGRRSHSSWSEEWRRKRKKCNGEMTFLI